MNIRNEWERLDLNQKVWISLAGALTLLAVAIGCFKLVELQNWYVPGKGTDTCYNTRLLAVEVGQPQLATPYKLGRWEQKNIGGYDNIRTVHLSRGHGLKVVVRDAVFGDVTYVSKESRCLSAVKHVEEDN